MTKQKGYIDMHMTAPGESDKQMEHFSRVRNDYRMLENMTHFRSNDKKIQ